MSEILDLIITFMLIGVSAFGGGYAVMPLIQKYVVTGHRWITMIELVDITSISQMTPGPIMTCLATFVGLKVAGFWGGILATFAVVLPSFFLVWILSIVFEKHGNLKFIQNILKGLRPTIIGMIFVAAVGLIKASLFGNVFPWESLKLDWVAIISFVIVLGLSLKTKWDVVIMVGLGGALGLILTFLQL